MQNEDEVVYWNHEFKTDDPRNWAYCKYCGTTTTYDLFMSFTRKGMHYYIKSCLSYKEKIIKDIIE